MEKKKVKPTNHSTKRNKVAKKYSPVFGDVWGHRAWKDGKLTDTIRDIIIKKMQEFIEGSPEWNSIPQFAAQLGLPYITYMTWAAEDEDLKPIHKQFVALLGAKRQPHAEWKKYGATDAIKNTLYLYHPDYKQVRDDDEAFKKELKNTGDEESKRDIIINIPAIGVKDE